MALKPDVFIGQWANQYWTEGTGGTTNFTGNGSIDENLRMYGSDPWGRSRILWRCNPNGLASDGNGGWNSATYPIDNTQLYRLSVWVNRAVYGDWQGHGYFGLRNVNSSNSIIAIDYLDGTSIGSNPYFCIFRGEDTTYGIPENEWVLLVGHVYPVDTPDAGSTAAQHPDSGIWRLDGTKYTWAYSFFYDFRWTADSARVIHRAYLYYSSDTSIIQYFCLPRVDLCDGTEPSLKALLRDGKPRAISLNVGTLLT